VTFQLKLFFAALSAAVLALIIAGVLSAASMRSQTDARIEATLISEARVASELLAPGDRADSTASLEELDRLADRIGAMISARVTFVARDGRVLGDSAEPLDVVARMQNHADRPEIRTAAETGFGRAHRYSDTLGIDMLYVAVPVRRADIAFVRLALPLSDISQQLRTVLSATLVALAIA
jgi:two-component system phosphate regulon sensor histidine kinase PhoR